MAQHGRHAVARPLLGRWPDVRALGRARVESIAEVVAAHSHDQDPQRRAERIRDAARGWHEFWIGRLDLDDLAWEIGELCDDVSIADARQGQATTHALGRWRHHWPDDVLFVGPRSRPDLCLDDQGMWGDGRHLRSAKAAGAFIGLNPSNWESGLSASPSRRITKEGPAEMRLAYYQAANVARRRDPQLALHYRRLMCERGHTHIQATCAVARKLAARTWKILQTSDPYEPRNLDGDPIDENTAARLAIGLEVPADQRRRNRATNPRRGRLDQT